MVVNGLGSRSSPIVISDDEDAAYVERQLGVYETGSTSGADWIARDDSNIDEGDGNLARVACMSAFLFSYSCMGVIQQKRTGSGSCHGIRNDRPELRLRNSVATKGIDDSGQLTTISGQARHYPGWSTHE